MKKFTKIISLLAASLLILLMGAIGVSAQEVELSSLSGFENYYGDSENPTGSETFGDVDFDAEIKVKDATLIQKHVAKIITFSEFQMIIADVNGDSEVSIKDASAIQKAVAKLSDGLPMSRVYNWDLKERSIKVSLLNRGRAKINITVPSAGFYYFNVEGVSDRPSFLVTVPCERGAYKEQSKLSVYLEAGEHELDIYNDASGDLNTVLSYYYSEKFMNFDKADAISVNGKAINVNEGNKNILLKVKGSEITNPVFIESNGTDPRIYSVSLYDSTLSLISNLSLQKEDGSNISGYLPAYGYLSDYYYVYIVQNAGGSSYTLTCGSSSEVLMASAENLNLDVKADLDSEYVVDESSDYTLFDACFKFTPSKAGYYEFYLSSNSIGEIKYKIFEKASIENGMNSPLYEIEACSEMTLLSITDVESLEKGTEYYLVIEGKIYGNSMATIKASLSDAASYNEVHKDDFVSDKSLIKDSSTPIKVGERVFVEFDADKEQKWFEFTASEDLKLVIYSENSEDAYLVVLDENLNEIAGFDDIKLYDSFDFAVLGDVKKGEVYYLGAGSYQGDGDFYSICLVKESDYVPLN